MKLTLKRRFQNLADQVSFPMFFYIYESGKLIGANERAKELIGEETKNIKQVWKNIEKRRLPDKVLVNGRIFFPHEQLENGTHFLRVDMELCVFSIGEEHIVTVILEQSYKNAFGEENSLYIPKIIWRDKGLRLRGQNEACLKMPAWEIRTEDSFAFETRMIEEQLESYGVLKRVKIENGKQGFAKLNRITLINQNGNCVGILIVCELLKEEEEKRRELCRLQRQKAVLEESLRECKKIAYSICEDERGSVDYFSAGIKQFGYCPEEFYSGEKNWLELVDQEDRRLWQDREKRPEILEYRIYTKEGKPVVVCDKIIDYTVYREKLYRQGILWQKEGKEREEWESQ